eukprot:scaffold24901_cov186-Cylindrotheca_fusiformis.AAC.1
MVELSWSSRSVSTSRIGEGAELGEAFVDDGAALANTLGIGDGDAFRSLSCKNNAFFFSFIRSQLSRPHSHNDNNNSSLNMILNIPRSSNKNSKTSTKKVKTDSERIQLGHPISLGSFRSETRYDPASCPRATTTRNDPHMTMTGKSQ